MARPLRRHPQSETRPQGGVTARILAGLVPHSGRYVPGALFLIAVNYRCVESRSRNATCVGADRSGEPPPEHNVGMGLTLPRRLWTVLEPIHAVVYFAAQARSAFEDAGYRGFWRGYFAGRAAPLGPVGAEPVTAMFYGFAPRMVARALPGVWELGGPATALEARCAGAVAALTQVFASRSVPADDEALAVVLVALRRAVDSADPGGRPLGAANAGLPWPQE